MEIIFKIPEENENYPKASDFIISKIDAIMKKSFQEEKNLIFIHTNLKRGLPLENINKVAGPFVEAWALEQFEGILNETDKFELV